MLLGFLLNGRMPPKKSDSKVRKGCTTTEVSLPRVVPNMLSTRVKPSLPSLSNIFSATKMKPFSTPFARKSFDQSRHGGKVVKRSYISGSESESELDSVVGGKEASIEAEALAARRQGGKEASIEVEAVVARRQGGKEAGGYGQWDMWGMEVGHGGYRGIGWWGHGVPVVLVTA